MRKHSNRDELGRFIKGQRGPGRPKGRKSNSTLLREAENLKAAKIAFGAMSRDVPDVIGAITSVAKNPEHKHWSVGAKLFMHPFFRLIEEQRDPRSAKGGVVVTVNITGVNDGEEYGPAGGREVHGNGAAPAPRIIDAEGWESGTRPADRQAADVRDPDGDPEGPEGELE